MPKVFLKLERQETRDIENALRKLKRAVERGGVLKEVLERQHYERPGIRRNKKKSAGAFRRKRELQAQQLPKKMY